MRLQRAFYNLGRRGWIDFLNRIFLFVFSYSRRWCSTNRSRSWSSFELNVCTRTTARSVKSLSPVCSCSTLPCSSCSPASQLGSTVKISFLIRSRSNISNDLQSWNAPSFHWKPYLIVQGQLKKNQVDALNCQFWLGWRPLIFFYQRELGPQACHWVIRDPPPIIGSLDPQASCC